MTPTGAAGESCCSPGSPNAVLRLDASAARATLARAVVSAASFVSWAAAFAAGVGVFLIFASVAGKGARVAPGAASASDDAIGSWVLGTLVLAGLWLFALAGGAWGRTHPAALQACAHVIQARGLDDEWTRIEWARVRAPVFRRLGVEFDHVDSRTLRRARVRFVAGWMHGQDVVRLKNYFIERMAEAGATARAT